MLPQEHATCVAAAAVDCDADHCFNIVMACCYICLIISVQCRFLSQPVWCKDYDPCVQCRASTLCTTLSSKSWLRRSARQRLSSQMSRAVTPCPPCLPLVSSGLTTDPVTSGGCCCCFAPHALVLYHPHLCCCMEASRIVFAATVKCLQSG